MAYKLELPPELSNIHDTFHVSHLRKCLADPTQVVPLEDTRVDEKLQFTEQPVEILGNQVKKLKTKTIPLVLVRWQGRRGHEQTWELDSEMRIKYPHLYE